jgi:regulator of sigma E protease
MLAADGTTRELRITNARPLGDPRGQLGIRVRAVATGETTARPIGEWLPLSVERVPRLMAAVVNGYLTLPAALLTPSPDGPPLSGPAGITASIAESAADGGLPLFLLTIALISANIAVLNLLPIPPIDGGRIAGLLGTRIAPRVAARVGGVASLLGLLALLALAVVATFFDLLRAFD